MLRFLIALSFMGFVCLGFAGVSPSLYQVDMIVFVNQLGTTNESDSSMVPLIVPMSNDAIALKPREDTWSPYHLLPESYSRLRKEYWVLNRKAQYQVLGHFTWLQPFNNRRAVSLPEWHRAGWAVEGTMKIRQSNYYLFDAHLIFSSDDESHGSFAISQKKRLKPGVVYYLDHAQAGMLVTIHKVSEK